MIFCTLLSLRCRKYLAKITGYDSKFGMAREFLRYRLVCVCRYVVRYNYGDIQGGVCEASVKYFREDAQTPACIDRKLCIVCDGDCYNFEFHRFDYAAILKMNREIRRGTFAVDQLPLDLAC